MEFNGDVTWTGRNGNEVRITPPQGKLNLSKKWVDSEDGRTRLSAYSKSRTNTMGYRTKDSAETDAEEGTGLKASTNLPAADEFKNKTFTSFKSQKDRDKATKISAFSDDEDDDDDAPVTFNTQADDDTSDLYADFDLSDFYSDDSSSNSSDDSAPESSEKHNQKEEDDEDEDISRFYSELNIGENYNLHESKNDMDIQMYCPSYEECKRLEGRKKFISERADTVIRKYNSYLKEHNIEGYPVYPSIVEDLCTVHDIPFEDGIYAVANYGRNR